MFSREVSDGYDLPNETESVTLRKICNSSSSKTAYYDDTIKRISLRILYSNLRVKPNPPPKPLGLKVLVM